MKVGYVRSNSIGEIEIQVKSLAKLGVDKMFIDRTDKLYLENSQFLKMLEFLKPGYVVIIDEFECLRGNSDMVLEVLKELKSKNINMKVIGEEFNDISEIQDYIENGIGRYLIDSDSY
jgi:DNA invertase Pin-like site-specific DNA recombinase